MAEPSAGYLSIPVTVTSASQGVFNEAGLDIDFRVESDTNEYGLFLDGTNGFVGIGESTPDGLLHIKGSGSGVTSYDAWADDLILETGTSTGMTLASPASGGGGIYFRDPQGSSGSVYYAHADDRLTLTAGGLERMRLKPSETVFNEWNTNTNFRVESDTNTHALFVQGSDGYVGIGLSAPQALLHVEGAGATIFESTDNVSVHKFVRGTGASQDSRAVLTLDANTLIANAVDGFGPAIQFTISDNGVSDSELGAIGFVRDGNDGWGKFVVGQDAQQMGSVGLTQFSVGYTETVVNDQGSVSDFRVESDTNTHALFVQGSDGHVGINTSTPGGQFEIGVTAGATGPTSGLRVISEDGGGWALFPATAVANPTWTANVNSGESHAWSAGGSAFTKMTLTNGLYMSGATGGDKGVGTINATAVYDDDTLLTDFVLDQAVDGEIDYEFYDSLELGGKAAREWDPRNLDIDWYSAQWRERRSLPAFMTKEERFDADGNEIRDSIGKLVQGLQQELETAHVHIAQLNERLKELEAKL